MILGSSAWPNNSNEADIPMTIWPMSFVRIEQGMDSLDQTIAAECNDFQAIEQASSI